MHVPKTHPKKLPGKRWRQGYCLDLHTESSVFQGYNAFGHPDYATTRTAMGDLLYKLKYRGDRTALDPIAAATMKFLKSWKLKVDGIVPVPPSNPGRKVQTVLEIAGKVSELTGIPVYEGCVAKTKRTEELKN